MNSFGSWNGFYDFDEDDKDTWNYIPQLERQIYVRLWDKFNLDRSEESRMKELVKIDLLS